MERTIQFLFLSFLIPFSMTSFVTVKDRTFYRDSKPYYFLGTNFWYGFNLAAENMTRLQIELNQLRSLGITNLRIMASSQGPNSEPYRMLDPMELDKDGNLSEYYLKGLDNLLVKIKEYGMTAVVPLNNFWYWSGGFAQYVHWHCDPEPIPYPYGDVEWRKIVIYTKKFYTCENATKQYLKFYDTLANRVNTVTNIAYKDDPTIMAWQLANEPWPDDLGEVYSNWVKETIEHIKSIDSNHLVSIGIEG